MSMKQLINRRRIHRIPQAEMAEKMQCSHQWVSIIEGLASGETAEKWAGKYEKALEELLEEKGAK